MDFTPNPEQQAVADVVSTVLDRENTWEALVSGGVIALGVPDRLGGDGVGLPEIATALTGIGRHATISPAFATLGLGLVPLLDLASEGQQDRFLDGVAKGAILTAGLNEPGAAPVVFERWWCRNEGGWTRNPARRRYALYCPHMLHWRGYCQRG